MNSIVLFAASKDQRKYFTALSEHLSVKSDVVWYKSLKKPSLLVRYPISELWRQATLLKVRKQNSSKGRQYPSIVWPFFTFFQFLQACWLYSIYAEWLISLNEQSIGVWNGKKFRQAVLVIAAARMNKKTLFFETGPLPGVSAIDPKGVNFYSSIPNNVDFYLNRKSQNHIVLNQKQQSTRPGNLPENFILVPFQVVEDSNIYLHSAWIRTMRQLFAVCQSLSEQLNDVTFVFKEHPACNEQYEDLRSQQNAHLKFIDEYTTSELIAFSDAIITVNSTVGIEGLMAGKKVFVLGDALFGIEGISYPVTSEKALLAGLQNLSYLELNEAAIGSFIDYLKKDYAIPGNAMKSPDEIHFSAADKRIALLLQGKEVEALKLDGRD